MKQRRFYWKASRGAKNLLATFVFFAASQISLSILDINIIDYTLGMLFLAAGLYGIVCYSKEYHFIF